MTRSWLLSLGLLVFGAAAQPAAPTATPQVPRSLLKKRLEAAVQVYQDNLKSIRAGTGRIIDVERIRARQKMIADQFVWSEHWLNAELPLCETKAQRIAALKAHVMRTRYLSSVGGLPHAARIYYCIDAEVRYFEAAGKEAPPWVKGEKGDGTTRPAVLGPARPEGK